MIATLPRVLALAPAGLEGTDVVAAACRAAALGVLDLESAWDGTVAAMARVGRLTAAAFGVRLSSEEMLESGRVLREVSGMGVVWLPVAGTGPAGLGAAVGAARDQGWLVLGEATSRLEMAQAVAAGVDGLIVSGHEAGGRCGAESSFVLLQAALAAGGVPVWVRGGIGGAVAAGCFAAGAAGVVLDGALLLARESPLGPDWRARVARWDGSETTVVGPAGLSGIRVFAMPGSEALARLRAAADEGGAAWAQALRAEVGWRDGQCPPVGQDAALAGRLADQHVTVGGIIQAVERSIAEGIAAARAVRPLAESAPLAVELGTRYPILQGPMTRVSDVAAFAQAVADGGGLPFLALAMLRGDEVRNLLHATADRLAPIGRPWGVGILGFVPPDLRAEQLAVVRAVRPPWALIAGGRPDQAHELERAGIRTFLHVPSPGLLEQYLRDGCRRFVLEGRECGGHVGPRSSFVLWEQATALAADAIDRGLAAEELSLVLAGGIHDARSAALVATLAAPLAARGVKVGVLVGTAYIFTREAVETGAIVQRFQDEALRCAETVLLESGPGHQVRVSHTPVVARFQEERRRLLAEGRSAEEVRQALERFNVGRLRVATKALDRPGGAGAPLAAVDDDYQAAHGLYMLGQVATLRNSTTTIAELHRELCDGSTTFLARDIPRLGLPADDSNSRPTEIALIGMAAVFPGAAHVARFWSHTLRGVDAIIEVPPDRWDWRLYYDPDPKAPDKIVSKWGGFLPDVAFDPLRYGMPPSSLPSIEPAQLLALEVVRTALADAGYAHRPFPRERTAVVLGMGGGAAQLAMGYAFRSYLPMLDRVIPGGGRQAIAACRGLLPEWTEDSFPGFLLNVTAGRIANRFNLGGANYTVDAACGSSLAAAALAVRELEAGAADLVILGGVDTVQNPFTYLAFSKTQAFSPRGRCRPFDAGADGIVISEGVAALVLKRKADAERDGDRIYAVIRGVGASSDGRERGLTAPVVDGQVRALERAYARAAVSPATVGYVEAHGTGTALGDVVEVQSLSQVFRTAGAQPRGCVVGSVKSLIGHTKCAAGLAGLINATLALYHKVLPPTIGIESPNPRIDLHDGSFRLCTQAQPWLHPYPERPRRAGVSAFGFGGTNFHAVLEAYEGNLGVQPDSALPEWPIELLIWEADRPAGLIEPIDRLARALEAGARPALCDLAHTLIAARARTAAEGGRPTRMSRKATLVILAGSCHDLGVKLRAARAAIVADRAAWEDPRGVFFAAKPAWTGAPVAFLFPGQGAQSPGMLRELAVAFPEVRGAFEEFERVVLAHGGPALGPLIFPPPAFTETARDEARRALLPTEVAQPAVGAACVGMLRLMRSLGCAPDLVAGHSYGELVALHAAGVLDAEDLAELSLARGRFMQEAGHGIPGAMAALQAGPDVVERLIADVAAVRIANENGPKQTVVAGPSAAVGQVVERAAARGIPARLLPVSSAFHTELVAGARPALERLARERLRRAPDRPVYSNLDAAPHPADPSVLAARLGEHLASPVRFAQMIAALHRDGARVFLEVGPAGVLTPLVEAILADQPHLAVSCDATTTTASGLAAWLRAVARLVTAGLPLRLERLTAGRSHRRLDLDDLPIGDFAEPATPSTWLVNGSRARPLNGPEPGRLGAVTLPSEPSREGRGVPEGEVPHEPKRNQSLPLLGPAIVPGQPAGVPPARDSSPPQDNGTRNPHTTKRTTTNLAPPQADRVLESFQKTMQMFLEVQKATMLAYLHDRGAPAVVRGKETAAEHNAHARHEATPQPAAPEVDTPSISSPADAASAARNGKPWAVVRDPQAVPGPDRAAIIARLREIVRDRTGYPIETLDLDLDIEADLGIDSIKRVEILGKLRDDFPSLKVLSDSADVMDALTQARTLGAIVDRMASLARQTDAELRPATAPTLPDPPVARGGKEAGHPVARGGKVIGIDQGAGAPFSPPENDGSALPFPLAKGGPGGVARDLASLRCEPRPSTNPPPSLSRGEPLIGAGNGHVEPGPRAQRRVLE
ncbi:MAG TPA: beta-ketoacyl synthase N-terminal-like domain-containing protein, partial [Isosphaeraceae bacterium]|nr:beta-ketoacyl synthase N-terminal-like domain-containing protein [Isosphaeraceae bacterium]